MKILVLINSTQKKDIKIRGSDVLYPSYKRTVYQIYIQQNPFCVVNFHITVNVPIIIKFKGR
jgi:hypothetical protein